MRNVRFGRAVGAIAALLLVGAPLAVASAANASDVSPQATATVGNGLALRQAWANGSNTLITLTADIDLSLDGSGGFICGTGEPLRTSSSTGAIVVDGQGKYGITQACLGQRVLRDDVAGETVTLQGLTHFTGGGARGHGGGLRNNGPVNVVSSNVSGNHAFADQCDPAQPISGGVSAQDECEDGDGGGIYAGIPNQAAPFAPVNHDVTVTDSTVGSNSADDDGGGVYTQGSLTVTRSTFDSNIAHGTNFGGGRGGGAYADADTSTEDSTFSGNTAECDTGSGIWCEAVASGGGFFTYGTADVTNTTFSANAAGAGCGECSALGGGFYADRGATVGGSTFTENTASCFTDCGADGGGFASTAADVSTSTFTDNVAQCEFTGYDNDRHCDGTGGAFSIFRLGLNPPAPVAADAVLDTVSVDQSTLNSNAATYDGGAFWTNDHTVDVVASTFERNQVAAEAGGAMSVWPWFSGGQFEGSTFSMTNSTVTANSQVYGGAIDFEAEHGNFVYDTITDNQVVEPPPQTCGDPGAAVACSAAAPRATASADYSRVAGAGAHATGPSGGVSAAAGGQPASLYLDQSSTLEPFGTVIAGGIDGDNCSTYGSLDSLGYNFEDTDTCNFSDSTDRPNGGDPGLGALADNGGPTFTQLPLADSPLIGAIPVGACDPDVTVDQRGVSRPQGNGCEIGSVEIEVFSPPLPPSEPSGPPGSHPTPIPEVVPSPVPVSPPAAAPAAAQAVAVAPRFTG